MPLCPACGARIEVGATRCEDCYAVFPANAALPDSAAVQQPTSQSGSSLIFDDPSIFDVEDDFDAPYDVPAAEFEYEPAPAPDYNPQPRQETRRWIDAPEGSAPMADPRPQRSSRKRGKRGKQHAPQPEAFPMDNPAQAAPPALSAPMPMPEPDIAESQLASRQSQGGTAAMVFAVLSVVTTGFIFPLLAAILGHSAYKKTGSERAWTARLVGLVVLVSRLVTAIIVCLSFSFIVGLVSSKLDDAIEQMTSERTPAATATISPANANDELSISNSNEQSQNLNSISANANTSSPDKRADSESRADSNSNAVSTPGMNSNASRPEQATTPTDTADVTDSSPSSDRIRESIETIERELKTRNEPLLDEDGRARNIDDQRTAVRNAAEWAEENRDRGLFASFEINDDSIVFEVGEITYVYAPLVNDGA